LNESGFNQAYATQAVNIGHAEYPGDQCFVAGWLFDATYNVFIATPSRLVDLYGTREYPGIAPFIISEYGDYEYGGTSNVHRATWLTGGYSGEVAMLQQAWNHQNGLNLNRGLSNMCGDGLWVGFDYGPYPQGIIDKLRVPKFSHYFFRSQRDPNLIIPGIDSGPMVYIANYWTSSSPHDVNVYSNCDQVKLYINDVNQGIRTHNTDANSVNLLHPPFSFTGLTWASGELKAEGYIGGNLVATHIVRTPGTASSIIVSFDASEMVADGSDIIFVYASVVDANGTVVPTYGNSSSQNITFNVTGPATLVSPSVIRAEAGISTALLRSSTRPGQVTVTVTATGLSSGTANINSIMGERVQD
jgi:beta-galactosidase